MLQSLRQKKKEALDNGDGFTIIEVMIVLVIAAVIILIVFLAVPALQRNSRNNQRNTDAGKIATAVTEFANNNRGNPPTTPQLQDALGDSLSFYVDDSGDPTVTMVDQGPTTGRNGIDNPGAIRVVRESVCEGSDGTICATDNASGRQFAVQYSVETASGASDQCLDA